MVRNECNSMLVIGNDERDVTWGCSVRWSTVGDGDGVLIGMGAGAGKSPARSRLMHDDAYVSIVMYAYLGDV